MVLIADELKPVSDGPGAQIHYFQTMQIGADVQLIADCQQSMNIGIGNASLFPGGCIIRKFSRFWIEFRDASVFGTDP